jgi:HAD superfamily hydrolase (TIGR01549 family)
LLLRLGKYRLVFWDFDGVIKESVDIKTEAFKELFSPFGDSVVEQVIHYHLLNGGVSRVKKIEYALKNFIGRTPNLPEINELANRFSSLVKDKVISSPWVPGAEPLLRAIKRPPYVLITGTPQAEINWILNKLSLINSFKRVYGAPTEKIIALQQTLRDFSIDPSEAIFIGDSITDYEAAHQAGIVFLLRSSPNTSFMVNYDILHVQDFISVSID